MWLNTDSPFQYAQAVKYHTHIHLNIFQFSKIKNKPLIITLQHFDRLAKGNMYNKRLNFQIIVNTEISYLWS